MANIEHLTEYLTSQQNKTNHLELFEWKPARIWNIRFVEYSKLLFLNKIMNDFEYIFILNIEQPVGASLLSQFLFISGEILLLLSSFYIEFILSYCLI